MVRFKQKQVRCHLFFSGCCILFYAGYSAADVYAAVFIKYKGNRNGNVHVPQKVRWNLWLFLEPEREQMHIWRYVVLVYEKEVWIMIRSGEAIETVQAFFNAYLVQRNLEGTLDCLIDGIQWVGTGISEMVCGRDQAEEALQKEFSLTPEPCRIVYGNIEENICSDHCAVVLLTACVYTKALNEGCFWMRVTAACIAGENGKCRIASIHASTPESGQEEGGYFPAPGIGRSEMEQLLGIKALDILGKSIPGGMMGGYLEPGFPLYYVNDLMLSYLGYTYEEFTAAIDGKVINCMHPEDRAAVDALVAEAFDRGEEYEIQYRMRKKDGSYIWVNDVGKKGLSEDGREVCVSVVRDISSEIEAREQLKEQAEEQKRLAAQYNWLLQSVLCGIVQYRLNGQDVVFKNANREAIRIFGYTPEEFWEKQDWNLASMIAEEDREYILKAVTRLKKQSDKSSYEYRLLRKDGTSCWIIGSAEVLLDSEGEKIIQSVFLDIDGRKKIEQRNARLAEQVEASNEILHLALEHTATCEYYYYPQTGECIVPERTCGIYKCRERYTNMPYSFAADQVDESFHSAYYEMYERIQRGERTASCEYRGKNGAFWCRETLSEILNDENGMPRLVIGIVENITRQKEMEEALLEARSKDSLTGLYNKEKGIGLVQEYLSHMPPGEHGVLMLLDMDDFEMINQKEGTIFADAVLQEVADILYAETGPDNIQIRLGGDEFMLFIKNSNKAQASVIGPRIAAQVGNILENTEKNIKASVSIGMCSTEVVKEYNALYRCAESTLKYVKENGKGQAACYLDTSNELGIFLTQLYTEEHQVNEIELDSPALNDDLISFALDLLGKSKNLDDAVFLLLSRIGKTYHFDRVSIIETNRAYLSYRFSYQWARNRSRLQLGQDFYVSDEDFDICANMYDEDGLAEHNVREDISDFPSCLHAGIWNYGEYAGSMSFEVDKTEYHWTREQRKLLKELVKIVPSFIMKSKADAVSRAKTDFLSQMSHEIRTPMNAISGMTTIAKSVLDDPVKAMDCLEKIETANTYLLSLINDILNMSRIESGKLELNYAPMDLSKQLADLKALFRVQAEQENLTLSFENGYSGTKQLEADGLRLNQVLVNIIGNAIKFTEHGGITVRVEELESAPRAVLRFSVEDTGIGIEPSAISRIFNSFEQADAATASRHGGTGLGLAISSRLVQKMGGMLEVRSEVGKGSVFYFTLTFEYAKEEMLPLEEETETELPDFHGRRILMAEDNEINREIAKAILEMNGFTVICANDGAEALEKYLNSGTEAFDAVLMDIRMPVMDGLETTRRIRTSGLPDARTIPIIALTANAFDEDTKKSIASGMNGHLSKPIQVKQMLELLGKCMERQ